MKITERQKAVLEIDGNVHDSEEAKNYDEARTEIFAQHGIKTYRIKNEDCNLQNLLAIIEQMPHPSPARRGAGGEVKAKIEKTAQAILDARAKYPDSSLADLYDETLMPAALRKAHRENDAAVMQAYGFNAKMSESEIVGELFKLYEELVK